MMQIVYSMGKMMDTFNSRGKIIIIIIIIFWFLINVLIFIGGLLLTGVFQSWPHWFYHSFLSSFHVLHHSDLFFS